MNLNLTKENIKNRLKAWKLHFAITIDIKNESGLVWDEDRKIVVVTANNFPVWNDYVKVCFYSHMDPYILFFLEICLSVWKADIHVMVVFFVFS